MKNTSLVKKVLPLLLFTGLLWSCDDEFSTVGSDIVGNDDLNLNTYTVQNLTAYSKATGTVQANGLPVNSLGVINNPVFGKTVVSFVTQLQFVTGNNPTVDIVDPTITKVELTVPYFSKIKNTNAEGNRTFTLDSLYGDQGKIKLGIYESGYYLRDFDPSTNFEEAQKHYSDLYQEINSAKGLLLNDADDVAQNNEFFFDSSEVIIYEETEEGEPAIKERQAPQMKIELNKDFFQQKIFNAPPGQMDNNNTFANYFKGLFFQVEDIGQGDHLMQMDFSQGKITIYYHTVINEEEREGTLVLNLQGNTVSLVESQFSSGYENALASSDSTIGDEKIYIKGSEGSLAYIDLFGDTDAEGNSAELEQLRDLAESENWLINEANLVFYVDKTQMDNVPYVPTRLYLFNADNSVPLTDYTIDGTTAPGFTKLNKYVFGGILHKENNKGVYYKIRITNHLKNLLKNKQAKNVKLGLAVTENINMSAMAVIKDQTSLPEDSPYRYVPVTSVMNPLGTVLYGNNTTDADKKLKLEILYTKP